MKWVKWLLSLLVLGVATAGGLAILFPRGHADPNISEEDAAMLGGIGISVSTQGSEGGMSAVMGAVSGIPSLKGGQSGDSIPSFIHGSSSAAMGNSEAPAFIVAATAPKVAALAPVPVVAPTWASSFPAIAEQFAPPPNMPPVPEVIEVPEIEADTESPPDIPPLPPLPDGVPQGNIQEITAAADIAPPVGVSEQNSIAPPVAVLRDKVVQYVQAQCVLIDSGDPKKVCEGYVRLSQLYEHSEMTRDERRFLEPLLEQLANDVIYSRHTHILEPPYIVRPGESVESIAAAFDISSQLLMRINGISDPALVQAGTELKVFRGPLDARLRVADDELSFFVGGLYAGRADVTGKMPNCDSLEGDFTVKEKAILAPGVFWIGLGGDAGLISTDQPERIKSSAVFILPTAKMAELYGILQAHSTVSIIR